MEKPNPTTEERATTEPSERSLKRSATIQSEPPSRVQSAFVVLLQTLVIALLLLIVGVEIRLRNPGILSNRIHIIYTTGFTALATLVTSITVVHIRKLWLARFASDGYGASTSLTKRASTVVGLSSLTDSLRCWPIYVSFLITGLMTTAIVSALTPTDILVTFPITADASTNHTQGLLGPCLLTSRSNDSSPQFQWDLLDGSYLSVNTSGELYCETQQVPIAIGNSLLDAAAPWGFRYTLGGVQVSRSAIGAPYSLLRAGFSAAFGAWNLESGFGTGGNSYFEWASQCFPTVARNPVRCQKTGNVTVGQNEVTVNAANCSITTPVYAVDPHTQGASSAGACTAGHDIGTATIVIGAVNEHAQDLANVMYDATFDGSQKSYSVACTVDIEPAMSFRRQNYSRESAIDLSSWGSSFVVDADANSTCDPGIPISQFMSNQALATGAAASWKLLVERDYLDGWWPSLYLLSWWSSTLDAPDHHFGNGSFSFSDSRNPLEDALGLSSGLVLGMFWGTPFIDLNAPTSVTFAGTAAYNGVRIGSGQWWAVVYILPSLFSIVLLLWLELRAGKPKYQEVRSVPS